MKVSSLSSPFIHRPVATTLLIVAIALAGALGYRFLPVSPLPQVDFPTIHVSAWPAGGEPRDDGLVGGDAAGAPVRPDRRRHRDDVDELAGVDQHHAAVRPEPQHRRRGARRAGGDQRGAGPAPGQPAEQPALPQGQPGRRADHDCSRSPPTSSHRPQMYDVASTILQQKLSQVQGVGQVFVGGERAAGRARRGESDRAQQRRSWARGRAHRAGHGERQPAEGRGRRWPPRLVARHHRPAAQGRRVPAARSSRYRNGAAVRLADIADVTDSVEDIRTRGSSNGKPAVIDHHLPPARREHHRDRRPRPRRAAAAPGVDSRRRSISAGRIDRTQTIRASVQDVEITLLHLDRPRDPGRLPVPAQARATLIPSVAVPDLARSARSASCTCSATASTTSR